MLDKKDRPFANPLIFKILYIKIGKALRAVMLREKNHRWWLTILKYMGLLFLKSIVSPLVPKLKKKIDHNFLSFRINILRNPASVLARRTKTLSVCITYRCNLICKYCYAKGLTNEMPMDMNIDDFNRLVIWAKANGFSIIRLLGGEVTTHPQFTEILKICYRNRMFVNLFTNNLFSPQIIPKLESFWLAGIFINYILGNLKGDTEKVRLFRRNLQQLRMRRIPFGFGYILSPQNENWLEMLKDVEVYKPRYIGISLSIPGFSKQISISEIFSEINSIPSKIFKMQENCTKLDTPFFIYRPLLLCMFSQEQWQRLRSTFPFVVFSRCPIGYRDNYATALMVNPDLSVFPCPSVFIKGPNIFSFKDRDTISQFYKEKLKPLLSKPLMDSCKNCDAHREFVSSLEEGSKSKSSFDEGMCQGGCLDFKEEVQMPCCMG